MAERISTRALHLLPPPDELRRVMQSLATLDAILCREWQYRYYSFDQRWAPGQALGSMRDGSGDKWLVLFEEHGAIGHGLAHESAMYRCEQPWPGIYESVPGEFATSFMAEPAVDQSNGSFCFWWLNEDPGWRRGEIEFPSKPDPDGSEELLGVLGTGAVGYVAWAEEYYERNVDLSAVERVFRHEPISEDLVQRLESEASVSELAADLTEIGYPIV